MQSKRYTSNLIGRLESVWMLTLGLVASLRISTGVRSVQQEGHVQAASAFSGTSDPTKDFWQGWRCATEDDTSNHTAHLGMFVGPRISLEPISLLKIPTESYPTRVWLRCLYGTGGLTKGFNSRLRFATAKVFGFVRRTRWRDEKPHFSRNPSPRFRGLQSEKVGVRLS